MTAVRVKEPFNGLSHLAGALLSVAGLSLLVTFAALEASARHVVSFALFGATMILLYTASAVYHLVPASGTCERRLKTLDHVMIFMLIAGTYTPICLVVLGGGWGWTMFGISWGLALAGMIFKLFWLGAPRWFSTAIYLLMGWLCLIPIYPLFKAMPTGGMVWLGLGGACYTLGAVVYATKRPNPWPGWLGSHGIWHLFVMGGTFCHFWVMLRYVLQMPV